MLTHPHSVLFAILRANQNASQIMCNTCLLVKVKNKLTQTIPIHLASLKHAAPQIFPSQASESLE